MLAPDRPAPFVDRYLAGELDALFGRPAAEPERGLIRPPVGNPDALADALAEQARRRGDRPAQLDAIERLRDPEARVVVTGQQAGLLLGPMFTLSKAITAIRLARRHDREERPVVPVFWVASQDHDAAEIDHAWLLGPDEDLHRFSLPFPPDVPSGRAAWSDAWTERAIEQLHAIYGDGSQARQACALLASATEAGGSVAEVFARLVSAVLGDQGLIVLDPMQPDVARLCVPTLARELQSPTAGPDAIRDAADRLHAFGVKPQLGRADDATNLFVQEAGGPRRLLRIDGSHFHLDGRPERRLRAADLLAWLDDDPCAITPAAGLRPIVQDALLPTAQFVVGPGELRYVAQLKGVYDLHDVPMPSVVPRAHVTILEPPARRILEQHELSAEAFAADPDGRLRERLLAMHGHGTAFEVARARLETELETLLAEVSGIDPTLTGPVRRSGETIDRSLQRLRVKAGDALARRERVVAEQFGRLSVQLLPDGRPQERVLSPFSYFAKFGVEPVMSRLLGIEPEGRQVLSIDP